MCSARQAEAHVEALHSQQKTAFKGATYSEHHDKLFTDFPNVLWVCRPPLDPPSYVDSAEVVDGADLSKNGLRIRIKTYFNRQKMDVPTRVQEVTVGS